MDDPVRVVIEQTDLCGLADPDELQKVATVYLGRYGEYRIYAPGKATGKAIDWTAFFSVHTLDSFDGEVFVRPDLADRIAGLVAKQLAIEQEHSPDKKQHLESALRAAKDLAIEWSATYAAKLTRG